MGDLKTAQPGYWKNILIGLDQFAGTIFGIPADITISGWVGYNYPDTLMERAIIWSRLSESNR